MLSSSYDENWFHMILSVILWPLRGSLHEKLETAAAAGLTHISLTSEHARWTRAERRRFTQTLRSRRMRIHLLGATPTWREKGISMVDRNKREELLEEVRRNIRIALDLEAPALLLMAGQEQAGVPRDQQHAELVESCKRCAEIAAAAGVTLALEPLNTRIDHPRYFLYDGREAIRLAQLVDNPHLTVALDIYHQQAQDGRALEVLREGGDDVGIVHIADFPGRGEPGTGAANYAAIYSVIRDSTRRPDLVLEYKPPVDAVASLRVAVHRLRAGVGA
jgi:hydroxypyruvate isomerase